MKKKKKMLRSPVHDILGLEICEFDQSYLEMAVNKTVLCFIKYYVCFAYLAQNLINLS